MRVSRRLVTAIESAILHALLLIGVVISVFPFYWMVVSSLKAPGEIFTVPPKWWVSDPVFTNYPAVFAKTNFATGFLNSCFVTITRTSVTVLLSAMAGFAFAKYDFPGRDPLFVFLMGTMMIPGVVTLIPSYMVILKLGWIDTYQALIIPGIASAFGTFLMRQYMYSIPGELIDAAHIDGAGDFRIFFQIALPMSVSALASLGILSFFGNWNALFWPMIVIRTKAKFTLPLSLMLLRSRYPRGVEYSVIFAGSFMATLPTLLVFLLLQRYFISGVEVGAFK